MKRILIAVAITLALTAAYAQPGERGGGQRGDPTSALKTALNLTDAQVDAIKALAQTGRERSRSIMTEIDQKRQTLNNLLSAASPSPVDVGNAAIALRASENKLSAERDWFIGELKKQLTGEQQQKLDTLLAEKGGRGLPIPGLGGPRGGPRGGLR